MASVTILELPAVWNEPTRMLEVIDREIARRPTDLVLVPEAALTGYVSAEGDFDLRPFAEPSSLDGRVAALARAIAVRRETTLIVPLALREKGAFFNAAVAFAPDGSIPFVYRKRHPWYPETWATPGSDPPIVVVVADLRVTIAICFDVHFLATDAAASLDDADLLLFSSAWVGDPGHRLALLRDLAVRFDIAVANANWAPGVVRLEGQGGSAILAAGGKLLATATGGLRVDAIISPRSRGVRT